LHPAEGVVVVVAIGDSRNAVYPEPRNAAIPIPATTSGYCIISSRRISSSSSARTGELPHNCSPAAAAVEPSPSPATPTAAASNVLAGSNE